jgi:hypothetical protein
VVFKVRCVAVLSVRSGVRGSMVLIIGSKWCLRFEVWSFHRFEVVFEVLWCFIIGFKWCSRFEVWLYYRF